ncbi:phosphoenolpyruvate--protein phosphotransferase [Nocardia asteroides]|uniref:phosphoenolpyruvate--protein phosphotransferase n=1 Tax=Nocardia asteroides TaxID=1824 RepID=UPI001E2906F1|nr:phosphoenolpyruvate--protein phosphotransferase [Nocardia asteroides]UGT55570.1 phosphoenolpyruvate--protein phosphotransferase [Nocardia asteroides]
MIGIVAVSHSHALATAALALAGEMLHDSPVRIEQAAGLDEHTFGTDAVAVSEAIAAADSGDGVLVLMDMGSAVLSAELALDLLAEEHRVRLCAAPFVEGLIAAAVSAAGGADLDEVAEEASNALAGKQVHLGAEAGLAAASAPEAAPEAALAEVRGEFVLANSHGLHARPAAKVVGAVRGLDSTVVLRNVDTGAGPVPANSLSRLAALGALVGHRVAVTATGPDASTAVERVLALAATGFGEEAVADTAASASGRDAGTAGDLVPGHAEIAPMSAGSDAVAEGGWVVAEHGAAAFAGGVVARDGLIGRAAGASTDAVTAANGTGAASGARPAGALPASPGIGIGACWHPAATRFDGAELDDPGRAPTAAGERDRLAEAVARARAELDRLRAGTGPEAEIFEAHQLLLDDPALLDGVQARIIAGEGAAAAWAGVLDEGAADLERLPDEYQRARAADLRAVRDQVLAALLGRSSRLVSRAGVLVAPDLTPAEAAALDPDLVTGVVLAHGSPTAHSAILLRAQGIPAVVGAGPPVLEIPAGTTLALDGQTGALAVDPAPGVLAEFADRAAAQRRERAAALAEADKPAVTRDGVTVHVAANVGELADATTAVRHGADLAGLVRTEFLFLDRAAAPSIDEQEHAYRALAEAFDGRPLILRTLDVGGDKPLPYVAGPAEANPFLGVRGIRLALARPQLLRDQLTAIGRVAADHPVGVMFPMVTTLAELARARAILAEMVPSRVRLEVGIMVEVPAAAAKTAAFAHHVDFLSIGTNDLTQYAMAAERGNEALGSLADPLDPGVLHLIDTVCRGAAGRARVAVCGEAAADPAAAPILFGLGVHELSVAPPAVPGVKAAVRQWDSRECRDLAERALRCVSAEEVRALTG